MGTDNLFSDPTTYSEADDGASATVKLCPRPTVVHVVGQVIELAVTADEQKRWLSETERRVWQVLAVSIGSGQAPYLLQGGLSTRSAGGNR